MKSLVTAFFLSFLLIPVASAETVSGVDLPESMDAAGTPLVLNGAGIRKKLFMDIYVGALYLKAPSSDNNAIIKADEPMAIKLHIVSDLITSDAMVEATEAGFDNATGGNTDPIRPQIDEFMAVFKEQISKGDVFDIMYVPGSGVMVSKNGEARGTVDGGMPFKEALYAIWLGDGVSEKALKKLQEGMLGG